MLIFRLSVKKNKKSKKIFSAIASLFLHNRYIFLFNHLMAIDGTFLCVAQISKWMSCALGAI